MCARTPHTPLSSPGLNRATQYAAASRFDHWLPGVLDPRLAGMTSPCVRGDDGTFGETPAPC